MRLFTCNRSQMTSKCGKKSGTRAAGNWKLMFLPHDIDLFGSLITEQTHDNMKYLILYNEQKRKKKTNKIASHCLTIKGFVLLWAWAFSKSPTLKFESPSSSVSVHPTSQQFPSKPSVCRSDETVLKISFRLGISSRKELFSSLFSVFLSCKQSKQRVLTFSRGLHSLNPKLSHKHFQKHAPWRDEKNENKLPVTSSLCLYSKNRSWATTKSQRVYIAFTTLYNKVRHIPLNTSRQQQESAGVSGNQVVK